MCRGEELDEDPDAAGSMIGSMAGGAGETRRPAITTADRLSPPEYDTRIEA